MSCDIFSWKEIMSFQSISYFSKYVIYLFIDPQRVMELLFPQAAIAYPCIGVFPQTLYRVQVISYPRSNIPAPKETEIYIPDFNFNVTAEGKRQLTCVHFFCQYNSGLLSLRLTWMILEFNACWATLLVSQTSERLFKDFHTEAPPILLPYISPSNPTHSLALYQPIEPYPFSCLISAHRTIRIPIQP